MRGQDCLAFENYSAIHRIFVHFSFKDHQPLPAGSLTPGAVPAVDDQQGHSDGTYSSQTAKVMRASAGLSGLPLAVQGPARSSV